MRCGTAGGVGGKLITGNGVFMWGYSVGDRFKRYWGLYSSRWLQIASYVRAGDGLVFWARRRNGQMKCPCYTPLREHGLSLRRCKHRRDM